MAEITKVLATLEDLALGKSTVPQERGGVNVTRKKINAGVLGGTIVLSGNDASEVHTRILDYDPDQMELTSAEFGPIPIMMAAYQDSGMNVNFLLWDTTVAKADATSQSGTGLPSYIDPSVDNANQGNGVGDGVWVVW